MLNPQVYYLKLVKKIFFISVFGRCIHCGASPVARVVLAVDIGTTGVKAALLDEFGNLAVPGAASYARYSSGTIVEGNKAEQSPEEWYEATLTASRDVLTSTNIVPAAIVLSGQMQDTILVSNAEKQSIRPAILYSDCRASEEAAYSEQIFGGKDILQRMTGMYTGASSVLAKLLWLQQHEPVALSECDHVLFGAHSYICWRLCQQAVCDFTTASTTGLLDVGQSPPVWLCKELRQLKLDPRKLPSLKSALEVTGRLAFDEAQRFGLPEGLPVIHGSGDLGSTSVGAGAGVEGVVYAYVGTSGWVARARRGYIRAAPGAFALLHPDPSLCIHAAAMMTAGGNIEWIRRLLCGWDSIEMAAYKVDVLASQSPPGSKGLIYLPYLAGERSPFEDPDARGAFIGLGLAHTKADLCRAVLEGVAFAYKSLLRIIETPEDAGGTEFLYLVGGGAKSKVWQQIFADALQTCVKVEEASSNAVDTACKGAAIIAAFALKWRENLTLPVQADENICQNMSQKKVLCMKKYCKPIAELYEQMFKVYLDCTELLRLHVFHCLQCIKVDEDATVHSEKSD